MVVAVSWRKNEDDPKMDGHRLKSEVIVMDKEYTGHTAHTIHGHVGAACALALRGSGTLGQHLVLVWTWVQRMVFGPPLAGWGGIQMLDTVRRMGLA